MGIPGGAGLKVVHVDIRDPKYMETYSQHGGKTQMTKREAESIGLTPVSKSAWDRIVDEVGLPSSMKSKSGFSAGLSSQLRRVLEGYTNLRGAGGILDAANDAVTKYNNEHKQTGPEGPNFLNTGFGGDGWAASQDNALPSSPDSSIEVPTIEDSNEPSYSNSNDFLKNVWEAVGNVANGARNGISSGEGTPNQNEQGEQVGNAKQGGMLESLLGYGLDHVYENWRGEDQTNRLAEQQQALMHAETQGLQHRYNTLYPNTSQWERLGAAGANSGGSGVSSGEAHRMAMELKSLEGQNMKEVAQINAQKDGYTSLLSKYMNKQIGWYEFKQLLPLVGGVALSMHPAGRALKWGGAALKALKFKKF